MSKDNSVGKSGKKGNIKNLTQWKKGQSGNPKGKPVGVKSWSTIYRELFESGKFSQLELAMVHAKKANKGNHKAFEMIQERMDGKAPINVDAEIVVNMNIKRINSGEDTNAAKR